MKNGYTLIHRRLSSSRNSGILRDNRCRTKPMCVCQLKKSWRNLHTVDSTSVIFKREDKSVASSYAYLLDPFSDAFGQKEKAHPPRQCLFGGLDRSYFLGGVRKHEKRRLKCTQLKIYYVVKWNVFCLKICVSLKNSRIN